MKFRPSVSELERAREYVKTQIDLMGARPNLGASQYEELVYKCALPAAEVRAWGDAERFSMGMRELEAAILRELREVTGKKKLRQKDIQEWSTGEIKAQEGETVVQLPGLKVNVAYKES